MTVSQILEAIDRLSYAQQRFTEMKTGYDGTKTYDVRHFAEAANALAKRIVDIPSSVDNDDIPF